MKTAFILLALVLGGETPPLILGTARSHAHARPLLREGLPCSPPLLPLLPSPPPPAPAAASAREFSFGKHHLKKHVSGAPAVSGAPISGAPGSAVTPGSLPVDCQSVAAVAAAAGNFSTLLAAANAAGLAGSLSSTSLAATVSSERCS